MNDNRIVLKGTNKRDAGCFLLFVFLLPYVCACLWGHVGEETEALRQGKEQVDAREGTDGRIIQAVMSWGIWEIPLEEYLVYQLAAVMPETYEPEALKAQAVLLRTEVIQVIQEQGITVLQVSGDGLEKWYEADAQALEALRSFRQAVEDTDGLYLCYGGKPIQASYFKISNGQTRDAGEVWNTERCPYLTSVACEQDKAAPDYYSEVAISQSDYLYEIQKHMEEECSPQELWEGMRLTYDGAGYVTNVSFYAGDKEVGHIEGEAFRYLFSLASASFEAENIGTQMIFRVEGVGHGFGMSQYGANCRAINGETYDQILKDFFVGTELAKLNNLSKMGKTNTM
ncbi:MAG: SpoIID/LytB domain-containing protein [Lachnospiraceae bacterium]|nr:SpoIID/LytB domain-containing protein [Lachnospiraceae bacterium]